MTAPIRRTVDYSTDPVALAKQVGELARDVNTQLDALRFATPVLMFSANSVAATTAMRFLFPWYENALAPTTRMGFKLTRAGTLGKARLMQTGSGNGNTIVFTVDLTRRGVTTPTAIVLRAASTATEAENLSSTASALAGDTISIRVTKETGIGASPGDVSLTLEFGAAA